MRLLRLAGKLNEMNASVGVDLVVFEAARHAAPKMQGALVVHAELQGQIKAWCDSNDVQYRGYSPTEIKKHATGKGNANKEAVMHAAANEWPHTEFVDDNHADARWLLDLATTELSAR
jgi:Holliday junction resolvasome RuvABC endonuclease subunit